MCLDCLDFKSLNFKVYDSNLTIEILYILINVYKIIINNFSNFQQMKNNLIYVEII
jgi:hypothetical protein